MSITMIACADINNGIGNDKGELLFKFPKDLSFFKSITSGKVIVMGRKTWDSLPKKPLEKRKNYVLTRNKTFSPNGAKVIHTIDEVLKLSKTHEVFIIGGGEIYSQFMEHADRLIMTHVHVRDMSARTFFPEIKVDDWKIISVKKHEADKANPHDFTFATYERQKNT